LGARNGRLPPAVIDHHLSVRHAIYTLRHPVLPSALDWRIKSGSVTWSSAIWPSSEMPARVASKVGNLQRNDNISAASYAIDSYCFPQLFM
jgi:hypothetical protein